jgi:hypothetical protein
VFHIGFRQMKSSTRDYFQTFGTLKSLPDDNLSSTLTPETLTITLLSPPNFLAEIRIYTIYYQQATSYMKGMAIDKEFLIGLLIVTLVFIIGLLFFMKVWTIGGNETSSTQGQSADCARWLSESPACRVQEIKETDGKIYQIPDTYQSLIKAYSLLGKAAALEQAKKFCKCP